MPAILANHTNKTLCQDAVQGRYKVVRLDSHVQETSEDVNDIVRVDSGEDQMSGQSRLNCDLGGFGVTDFANHDLIRIVTKNGPQTASKSQSLFLVDGDLGYPLELVFHRIFDCNNLVLRAFDLRNRGIEGSCLSASSRPGH